MKDEVCFMLDLHPCVNIFGSDMVFFELNQNDPNWKQNFSQVGIPTH